ncbi:MAG TPA: BamA/TamA family outer membrane protein [Longimicrobiales bacterium]|nr:BamA/TamA family outer membrane protein [Longimicrobiales bacterium]
MGCCSGPKWLGLAALVVTSGCATSEAARRYPDIAERSGTRIDDVLFVDPAPFRADTLLTLTETQPSRCNFLGLPFCVPFTRIGREEHRLSTARVAGDVETLERFYRIAGYFGTRVTPAVEPDGDNVDVRFSILRGDPIVLDALTVTGTEGLLDPDSLARTLRLQPGDIFHLGEYIEASEYIVRVLQRRGHAHAEVFRSFSVDTVDNRAEASIDLAPGPVVTVDSIIVTGAPHLSRQATLRPLEIREGQILRSGQLIESQRNLYNLELVSLASVTIAPDSLQRDPSDNSTATIRVAIAEAPLREVEAAVGFGTVECLRTDAQWAHRSWTGGARRLALRGSLSRIGVGEPFAINGGERVCSTQVADTLFGGNQFDYRFAADFTQPYFLNPRNQLNVSSFVERVSEPGVFSREALGGRVGVSRRLAARSGISANIEVENGQTIASPALFCAAFLVCQPATIDSLAARKFRAELGGTYFMDATNAPLEPTAGYLARTTVGYATPLLGSDVRFFRWTGEVSNYREVRPRWVAAFSLRLGNFFRTATVNPEGNFLPPEERFYAGGASSVRGYPRNALGPGIYVTDSDSLIADDDGNLRPAEAALFVPTGGTALAVTSAELRLPSPVLPRMLRLALFVDAGAIGTGSLWDLGPDQWKITPGAGVRLQTPVGPVRIDLGINPYDPVTAPLLVLDPETGGLRRIGVFTPRRGNIFSRMQIHLGVGHAF